MLDVVSLFSGIEGFGLGLERTGGFRVVAQVEQDPYCLSVLERHWPHVPRFTDIREVGAHNLPGAHVVTGGFPCQGISWAGLGLGLADERSGLWSEMLRVVRELRPRYVVVENVSALLVRGLDVVLGGLAAIGYDAEWDCIPASAVGAPHRRDRIWLVAYPNGQGEHAGSVDAEVGCAPQPLGDSEGDGCGPGRARGSLAAGEGQREPVGTLQDAHVGHAASSGWNAPSAPRPGQHSQRESARQARGSSGDLGGPSWWTTEPDVGRVAHGIPDGMDRLRSLGNSLVPQIAEFIGQRIIDYEEGELSDAA